MEQTTFRQISKIERVPDGGREPTIDDINTGSLQRIADALEVMEQNYSALIREWDDYERRWRSERAIAEGLERRIRSLKGVITRLRSRLGIRHSGRRDSK